MDELGGVTAVFFTVRIRFRSAALRPNPTRVAAKEERGMEKEKEEENALLGIASEDRSRNESRVIRNGKAARNRSSLTTVELNNRRFSLRKSRLYAVKRLALKILPSPTVSKNAQFPRGIIKTEEKDTLHR